MLDHGDHGLGERGPAGSDGPPDNPLLGELQALTDRTKGGEPGSDLELKAWLDRHPEVWHHLGDLAKHAEHAWLELIGGPDPALKGSVALKAAELRAELCGASPSPLEGLLADRVVACWLQVHHADAVAAQARDQSLKQADFALKRQDRAHRRYLSAMGALTALRRLLPAAAVGMEAPGPGAGVEPGELRTAGAESGDGIAVSLRIAARTAKEAVA